MPPHRLSLSCGSNHGRRTPFPPSAAPAAVPIASRTGMPGIPPLRRPISLWRPAPPSISRTPPTVASSLSCDVSCLRAHRPLLLRWYGRRPLPAPQPLSLTRPTPPVRPLAFHATWKPTFNISSISNITFHVARFLRDSLYASNIRYKGLHIFSGSYGHADRPDPA